MELFEWNICNRLGDAFVEGCNVTDDGNSSLCEDEWEIFENPCISAPCEGNDTCVDLTENATICDENSWAETLNATLNELELSGDALQFFGRL